MSILEMADLERTRRKEEGVDAVNDGPHIAAHFRDAAKLCTKDQPVIAYRLKLAATVIESLLAERERLLKRVELAEGQARINKEIIERGTAERAAAEVTQ